MGLIKVSRLDGNLHVFSAVQICVSRLKDFYEFNKNPSDPHSFSYNRRVPGALIDELYSRLYEYTNEFLKRNYIKEYDIQIDRVANPMFDTVIYVIYSIRTVEDHVFVFGITLDTPIENCCSVQCRTEGWRINNANIFDVEYVPAMKRISNGFPLKAPTNVVQKPKEALTNFESRKAEFLRVLDSARALER